MGNSPKDKKQYLIIYLICCFWLGLMFSTFNIFDLTIAFHLYNYNQLSENVYHIIVAILRQKTIYINVDIY